MHIKCTITERKGSTSKVDTWDFPIFFAIFVQGQRCRETEQQGGVRERLRVRECVFQFSALCVPPSCSRCVTVCVYLCICACGAQFEGHLV